MQNLKQQTGFSLIELLVAFAILSIIASVAIPSYRSYILRSKRIDAIEALTKLQMGQERFRSDNLTYASITQLGAANLSQAGHYQIAITGVSSTGYTLSAAARGSQLSDSDCATISMVVVNGDVSYLPSPKCWSR